MFASVVVLLAALHVWEGVDSCPRTRASKDAILCTVLLAPMLGALLGLQKCSSLQLKLPFSIHTLLLFNMGTGSPPDLGVQPAGTSQNQRWCQQSAQHAESFT